MATNWSEFKPVDPQPAAASGPTDWSQFTPVKQDRSYLGAAAEAGGRTLLAAGAQIAQDVFGPMSEGELATLLKDNPAKFQELTEKSAAFALSRYAKEQTARAKQVMQEVKPGETGTISGKPLTDLEYATLDPEKAAYLSPTRVAGDVLQSLPTTAALAVTAYLTKGASTRASAQAEAAALAKGMSAVEAKEAAKQAAITVGAETMAKTGAVSEGVVGYAQQMNDALAEAEDIKPEVYEQSPKYQALIKQGYAPEMARRQLIADTGREAGLIAGAVDAGTNLVGGKILGKIIGEGGKLGARAAKGFATESATELVQSGGEQAGSNWAMQNLNPNQDLTAGVGEAMAAGAVVGGVTGGGTAAVFGSRQRAQTAQAEQALKQATNVDDMVSAANALAGSVDELTAATNAYLGQMPPAAPAAPAAPVSPQAMVDRNAELLAKANQAGTAFEREQALAQAQTALPTPKEGAAAGFADLTPMDPRQAQQRLAILRDQVAQQGGNALELTIVPHPAQQGALAIGRTALPSLDLSTPTPAVSPAAAQNRIETAALTGAVNARTAEDQASRQVVIDRALRSVEERGGVASPAEARIFQEAGLGKPYDRVDESLAPALSADQKLTQATGIALDQAPRSQETQRTGATEQQLLQQESNARSDSRVQQIAAERAARQAAAATGAQAAAPAPNVDAVVSALRVPGTQRTAEQNLTIRQAQDRMAPADFKIAQTAASGPFNLSAEQRVRLREMRSPTPAAAATAAPAASAAPAAPTGLIGTRVQERLGQPTNGQVVTSNAKLATQRELVPGATSTLQDEGQDHTFTVADASALGTPGKVLQQIARIFGKRMVVFNSDTLKADGFVLDGDNRNIFVNAQSKVSPLAVFGHELLHVLKRENPKAYQALETVIRREMQDSQDQKDYYAGYSAESTLEEMTADLMGNRFQDPQFWSDVFNEIAAQNPEGAAGIVQRLAAALNRAITDFLKVVSKEGYKADAFVKDAAAVQAALKDALVDYAKQQRQPALAMEAAAPGSKGTLSLRRPDFTNPEERTEVSTTRPVPSVKKGRTGTSYTEKWVIDAADVKASEKHVAAVLRAIQGYNTLLGKGGTDAKLQELHDVVVENLLWLHDQVPADVRARAKLWYDGANRIANDWTEKYNVDTRQSSGVLAVLSPQMDWFKNVSLGERVINIWRNRQNEPWSQAMTDWVQSWVNASTDVDTKASRQAILDEVRPLQGMRLAEMDERQAALFIRAFDETYNERQYRLVTPEGGFGDYVTNNDDGDASVTWGGFSTIEKAVSILNDGSFKNVDQQLGDEHKVRNFYNNIISPGSADGHVTIDTHAVAAALIKGLSGSSQEVKDNFGSAGGNAETGASGTYGLFADAYRDAAAQRHILPREMQSITWEAVRALFPAALKDKLAPQVDAVWDRFKKGEITRDQARKEVSDLAGGIRKMPWEGSDEGVSAADGGTSYNTELAADPADRPARQLPPEVAKDKVSISLSASTMAIPGIAELQTAASKGDGLAHQLLQQIALDNLKHLLAGTSARIKADNATGLYGGYIEPSLSMTVSFADNDRAQVLAALAKFAENFNQEQVHVRRQTKDKAGKTYPDGSYATPVVRWNLKEALTRKQLDKVIEKSGLYGFTFGDDFIEAYYVGDPQDGTAINQFIEGTRRADVEIGKRATGNQSFTSRLWPYGDGDRTIGFDRIRGDVSPGPGTSSATAKRVAEYLAGGKVKTFEQAAEITPAQSKLQGEIAQVYESLPDNDLKNPNVRKAYNELAKEVMRQFKALPVKVEVMTGQGEPYANSDAMRRDILDNNHLFIFGTTPDTFGPPGEDFTGHPLLGETGLKDSKGTPLLYNDLLRAVHDYYAHAMAPTQFGPKGEEAAWKNHMSMTNNMWARWALTAETRGQNSWVNFRPEVAGVPVSQRDFARQKAVLLPVDYSLTGDRTVDKPMKEFIAKLGERVRQGTKPGAKLSRTRGEQAENDFTKVREKYLGTPLWMKAPNGKPTQLTERQWVQVRTPQFKEWFGDWEKFAKMEGGVWNDANGEVSKAVDANGEPLVVYHGTDAGGFSEFNTPGGQKRGDLGIFTSPNRSMAQTYVKRGRGSEIQFADMEREPLEGGDTSGYYASFMNLRNPQESDFEGAMWSGERPGQWEVYDAKGEVAYNADGKEFMERSEAEQLAEEIGGTFEEASPHYETTDSVVREASRSGNDGAIIRNVVDDGGGYSSYMGEPTDVFVALSPDQLKSATQNTGEFGTDTADMRFSRQRELESVFEGLSGRGLARTRAQAAAKARPDAARIDYVQQNFLDILSELDDSGLVSINCD